MKEFDPDYRRVYVAIRPIEVFDDEGNTWTRLEIKYQSGLAYECSIDLDRIEDIFILRSAIDSFVNDNNLTPPEK